MIFTLLLFKNKMISDFGIRGSGLFVEFMKNKLSSLSYLIYWNLLELELRFLKFGGFEGH